MIQAQYINLNMIPSGVMPVLYCSQYDIGRPLGMVVYNGGEAVDLDTYTCTIEATRTDGTAITAAVTTDDNIGVFTTTATMTNQADRYPAKLVLFDSNSRRVASLAFIMVVTERTMDENAESIEEDAPLYQQYTGTVQTLLAFIRTDIADETTRARAAESALQSNINAEATARANAINAEASARQAAVSAEASARQTADNNLQNAIASEASTRATTDASLQAQIDQMIAPSGEAPSAAEVQNARIGANGITYDTLGNAIRTQVGNLENESRDIIRGLTEVSGYVPTVMEQGSVNTNTGAISDNANYIRTNLVPVIPETQYTVYLTNNTGVVIGPAVVYYKADGTYLSSKTNWGNKPTGESVYTVTPPTNAYYLRFRYNKASGNITPAEVSQTMYDESSLIDNALVNYGVISQTGLDLDTGDFIHPGMWALADMTYAPENYPSRTLGRVISFASYTNSSYATAQIVLDNAGLMYYRISPANGSWRDWIQVSNADTVRIIRDNVPFSYANIETVGLDLDTGDFIHPGMWSVNDTQYLPYHSPTSKRCRIIIFSSDSDNSIYTYQIVIDADGKTYKRFSPSKDVWTPWTSETALHDDIAFKCLFINNETYINSNVIIYDTSSTNRVQTLMAKWDAATLASGVTVDKTVLGTDASGTFQIYNYKVTNGITGKPVVLVVFGEHGNEYNSAEIGSYFYQQVTDGVLTKYLKYVDFWLIPLMNPWGYENKQRNNANDVNLNRDFPCAWNYYSVQHNKTGNYSLSQPETLYLYNLLVNNRNKILFMINKHNTGSISNKININEEDIVGYTATVLKADTIFNEGLTMWEDAQVRQTDPWIDTDCDVDISNLPVIVNRPNLVTDGSMDLFANSIGIHGSLIEVCGSAFYATDSPAHYTSPHYQGLARLELDFLVNYVAKAIENNDLLLSSDDLQMRLTYKTRTEDGSASTVSMTFEQGSLNTNTGAESDSTERCRSSFGSITAQHDIEVSITNNASVQLGVFALFYDADQTFISSLGLTSTAAGATTNENVSPPKNARYVRFRMQLNPLQTITTNDFTISAVSSAWKWIEQYWNGQTLINIA